jgi:hypothetical protein
MTFVILATGTLGRLGANPTQRRIRAKREPKEARHGQLDERDEAARRLEQEDVARDRHRDRGRRGGDPDRHEQRR